MSLVCICTGCKICTEHIFYLYKRQKQITPFIVFKCWELLERNFPQKEEGHEGGGVGTWKIRTPLFLVIPHLEGLSKTTSIGGKKPKRRYKTSWNIETYNKMKFSTVHNSLIHFFRLILKMSMFAPYGVVCLSMVEHIYVKVNTTTWGNIYLHSMKSIPSYLKLRLVLYC